MIVCFGVIDTSKSRWVGVGGAGGGLQPNLHTNKWLACTAILSAANPLYSFVCVRVFERACMVWGLQDRDKGELVSTLTY